MKLPETRSTFDVGNGRKRNGLKIREFRSFADAHCTHLDIADEGQKREIIDIGTCPKINTCRRQSEASVAEQN